MADSVSYQRWTSRLREHFFFDGNTGVPVTFFVDGDVLAEVGGFSDARQAEASITSAVRPRLLPESSGDVFNRIVDESWTWRLRHPDSDPPFLPVLAVSVLAAAKMASTEHWAAHNYYEPLRALLALPSGKGMPPGYDGAMPALWGHLRWWLNDYNKGQIGVAAVPDHPSPAYIGYALSQALFRASDRQRLTHFFRALDLGPGEPIEPAELLAYFSPWAQRSHLSFGAKEMTRHEEYSDILAAILAAEARRWDGSVRDEHGRRMGQILVVLDLYLRPRLAFVAERPTGFPASATFDFGGPAGAVLLEAVSDDYYAEIPIKVSAAALESGLKGTCDNIAIAFLPSPIIPFRQHEALGGWASVRQLLPGQQHWILARADQSAVVRDYLQEVAMADWRDAPGIAPAGWTFFRDVVIDAAEANITDATLSRIVPSVRERPALWGGLPMSLNASTYLVGGEPDLWVPSAAEGAVFPIAVDGHQTDVEFRGGRVTLGGRQLPAGHHEIRVGPSRLTFDTVDSLGVITSRVAASLGHKLRSANGSFYPVSSRGASETGQLVPGTIEVMGTSLLGPAEDLPPKRRAPLLLAAKAYDYLVLGAVPGQLSRPHVPPDPPRWIEGVAPFSAGREFVPSFDVVWILLKRVSGWEGRVRHHREPQGFNPDTTVTDEVREWCRCFLDLSPQLPEPVLTLWDRYRAVAAESLT